MISFLIYVMESLIVIYYTGLISLTLFGIKKFYYMDYIYPFVVYLVFIFVVLILSVILGGVKKLLFKKE